MDLARSIGNDSFQNCALTAVGVFHTLLVGYLPIIVRRAVALADNTTKVTTLTDVELAICLAIHLLSTMCHAHRAVFIHRGEHRARDQVGLGFLGTVISGNTPASIQRNGRNGEIPALTEPSTATLTAVLYAQ